MFEPPSPTPTQTDAPTNTKRRAWLPSRRTALALSVPVLLTGAGAFAVATADEAGDRSAETASRTPGATDDTTGDALTDATGEPDIVPAAAQAVATPADVLALLADERSLDGTGNNALDPELGAAGGIYRREADANYVDGIGERETGPAERYLSNRIFNGNNQNVFSENGVTHWGFVWGQFIDHTIGNRATADDETMVIEFDPDDPLEEFTNDVGAITTDRSAVAAGTGVDSPRDQVNTLSSYIDGWAVYGGTAERLDWLREGSLDGDPTDNDASLLLNDGYLPTAADRAGAETPPTDLMGRLFADPSAAVIAGDVRVNENLGLTAVHTLFAREHNRIVDQLPDDLDEEVKFDIARRVVSALQQYITYTEFLPAMGVDLDEYTGYDPTVDPTITNEFATVGYRAHSQIHGEFEAEIPLDQVSSEDLEALARQGVTVEVGDDAVEVAVPLNVAFGNPGLLVELGLGNVLAGLSSEAAYANDEQIDNQLRSVLFQIPGPEVENPLDCLDGSEIAGCFTSVNDLGALDVMRTYDHGMPTYNELRATYGLAPVTSFPELTGEQTDELPDGFDIDDPEIMEFVVLRDADGNVLVPGSEAADGDTVVAERRSTIAARLKAVFGSVDRVDAFTGMVSEPHVAGTEFGELQLAMWTRQFSALRDGDRFFYDNDPALDAIAEVYDIDARRSLSEVIAANTEVEESDVPANVFLLEGGLPTGDVAADDVAGGAESDPVAEADRVVDAADGSDDDRSRRGRTDRDRGDRPPRRARPTGRA
ncbi:peroxidase family protein [Ilumatobacter sp.]|uniref:peroxidase family protein n=1 Tax=Ilumatobacter sp. TaxID=1967498 RepID=UPI003AF89F3D